MRSAALSALGGALLGAAACAGPATAPPSTPGRPTDVAYDSAPAPTAAASATGPILLGADYDAAVTTPAACLGFELGARPAAPEAIVACFRAWAGQSERVTVERYATTFEGRELVRAVITSPANQKRLPEILAAVGKLADQRGARPGATEAALHDLPAVAWFGYSIHGDEVSGADASLAFGYHLVAGRDAEVADLLEHLVVVIDPVMNPDGRARLLAMTAQTASAVLNTNYETMQRGWWPYGRGNHYLFDMNRDWVVGVMPETQGRWHEHLAFHPQLVVNAHEMGALDTYLFYPAAPPYNPQLPATLTKWQGVFAADHARAFDANGWAYYTREWADAWYPGYSDAWAALNGAIGILYEQAGIQGMALRRPSGRVVDYRESVLQQAVSSWSNLRTLGRNREQVLRDYAAFRRGPLADRRVFALVPGRAPDRERRLLTALLRQGIEVYQADEPFSAAGAQSALGERPATQRFAKGTWLVPAGQPQGALVHALLDFDPHLDEVALAKERTELERKGRSRMYDVTAWNLGMAFAVDGWWLDGATARRTQVTSVEAPAAGIAPAPGGQPAVAWIVDGRDDGSLGFAAAALARGLEVLAGDEAVTVGGLSFPRGSVLVRRRDNPDDVEQRVEQAARAAGVVAHAAATGRSPDDGPDLGGQRFLRLVRPRVAIVTNAPVSTDAFGAVWYLLDRELGLPVTLVEAMSIGDYDLRRYNVLVLPPGGGQLASILRANAGPLATWVRAGGTLIAFGSSAATIADKKLGLSQVRRREDVLEELELYDSAADRELATREIRVDSKQLWTPPPAAKPKPADKKGAADAGGKEEEEETPGGKKGLEARDAWLRRFAPQGTILRGLADADSWLTYGVGAELPVPVDGSNVFFAREPVKTAIRLAPPARLRLAGLLWPEARDTWGKTAWATVESVGAGQVILFATAPASRALFRGSARLLLNAIVLGPGLGASAPIDL